MLPPTIPLFPLPTTVLFPNVFLPLHIFEPRYRQMFSDALAGDRLIGMVLLRPGFEADYEGQPPIYPTGTSGLITHAERPDDGRFNVILRGLDKFTIDGEDAPEPGLLYRRATVTIHDEAIRDTDREAFSVSRTRLDSLLSSVFHGELDHRVPPGIANEDLVNALSQYLDFDPIEKLALLERNGPLARCR